MPNLKDSQVTSAMTTISNNILKISATSLVYENYWLNFNGTSFNVKSYVTNSVNNFRTRFFQNRDYAVFLLIGIDKLGNIIVEEGTQVKYSGIIEQVPAPTSFSIIPLVGLVIIQDGSNNLNSFKEINDKNLIKFSGAGNIVDKNKDGDPGLDSFEFGDTGYQGDTGLLGSQGYTGDIGLTGEAGDMPPGPMGYTGTQGMTGISWTIHFPFNQFI